MAGETTSIAALQDPSVPVYDPLAQASVPQQPATVITTAANGNGSVDNGGIVDQVVAAKAASDYRAQANAWSMQTFGMPLVAPSIQSTLALTSAKLLGAFVGGYHGYRRSGGKGLVTAGYALAGAIAPFITLTVGLVQGYGKPKHR